jgi:MoaA/NifB/PqqE/SkfB family radical SAM enzyme
VYLKARAKITHCHPCLLRTSANQKITDDGMEQILLDQADRTSKPLRSLSRVIVEISNTCNLNCSICARHVWIDPEGLMSRETFSRFLTQLEGFNPLPEVFLGGYGEPLLHPDIIPFISSIKRLGVKTGLVTNGTLINQSISSQIKNSGLDKLWISLDGAHQENLSPDQFTEYQDKILTQVQSISRTGNPNNHQHKSTGIIEVGLAFVLTNTNYADLLKLADQAFRKGIRAFFITNLEAYSRGTSGLIPYQSGPIRNQAAHDRAQSSLQKLVNEIQSLGSGITVESNLNNPANLCAFADKGELSLRWDGEISPCLPLLYSHTSYLGSWQREIHACSLGNINTTSLTDIWLGETYQELSKRLLERSFSPCLSCQDCWLSENNLLDCTGFEHPTCGGCLWAQGLISCPE